ncbi:sulfotransferase [Roseofilum sp. BLCC_M154]|uniref:Sulfotransferase n=1 Tax=Roseofilum acuticapitatum BLCC-M154 TaxID=3022444 RepID=A0ABT7AU08_9CYAN|nr:sulfotransferase [Roseofilum acuticapitatum]MDJ1170092.1 sulfotransferase [Roseofilum acuticapitatum BLCC-M154]
MTNLHFLYLTGLPCSGGRFLSQLLNQHPEVYSDLSASPLCDLVVNFRSFISTHSHVKDLLSQDFQGTMGRSHHGIQGFIQGWYSQVSEPWIVDFHPQWLQHLDLIYLLDPNCKMVVCVRELGQVYATIERQHQKTLLLDFPEKITDLSRTERAKQLFSASGRIGSFLSALEQVQDLEETLQQRLFYVVYEHLMSDPEEVLTDLVKWLDLAPISPDLGGSALLSRSPERFSKYGEEAYDGDRPLPHYPLPNRFEVMIKQNFSWFYRLFYPGLL